MMRRWLVVLAGLTAMDAAGQEGPKQSFEVSKTEHINFAPGGTIRITNSYGYLTVEGWDEQEVEIAVTKSTDRFYEPGRKEKAERHFDEVRVVAERRSDKELAISTTLPHRNSPLTTRLPSGQVIVTTPVPPNHKRGVTAEYTVHVPRDSRLIVHHDNGYVWVSDVTGDIEVRSHTGDMIVMLPDPDGYSINARTRVGRVSSDFTGKTLSQFLVGSHFAHATQSPAWRVYLRMGRGSITIKSGPPSGPYWRN
jgi:hypothetical protein